MSCLVSDRSFTSRLCLALVQPEVCVAQTWSGSCLEGHRDAEFSLSKERLSSEPKSSTKYKDVGWGSGHRHWVVCVYFGNAGLQTAAGELTPVIHHGRSSRKKSPELLGDVLHR